MNLEKIANLIKNLRKKSGLTQSEFAEKYHVSYQAVSKWENAKSIPDIAILKQICEDYNISLDTLTKHKNTLKTLHTLPEILEFDYTTGYPEKLILE